MVKGDEMVLDYFGFVVLALDENSVMSIAHDSYVFLYLGLAQEFLV